MTKYVVDNPLKVDKNHRSLLAIPLSVITVFCFGFVLMQSPGARKNGNQAAHTQSQKASQSENNIDISITGASLPKLSKLPDVQIDSSSSSRPVTASPQASNPINASGLQSAVPHPSNALGDKPDVKPKNNGKPKD